MSIKITMKYEQCYSLERQVWICRALVTDNITREIFYEKGYHLSDANLAKDNAKKKVIDNLLRRSTIMIKALFFAKLDSDADILIKIIDLNRQQDYLIDAVLDECSIPKEILHKYPKTLGQSDEKYDCDDDRPSRKLTKKEIKMLNDDLKIYMSKREC